MFQAQVDLVARHPLVTGLLNSADGLLAVVNAERQILALNYAFLQVLGIDQPEAVFGLRPGEALQCIYSHDQPGGCGTGRYCPTCGAAIAMVTTLESGKPAEQVCALSLEKDCVRQDLIFSVRTALVELEGHSIILVFLQDRTPAERLAAFQRVFFHDINNMVLALQSAAVLLEDGLGPQEPRLLQAIRKTAERLAGEITFQRALLEGNEDNISFNPEPVSIAEVLRDLQDLYGRHPAAKDKELVFFPPAEPRTFSSHLGLILRVLGNMVLNALEATGPQGMVRCWVDTAPGEIRFQIWNQAMIPEQVQLRLFQRHFSTKAGAGRGLGTYSMKIFGEKCLGGRVGFSSDAQGGTLFWLSLPLDQR